MMRGAILLVALVLAGCGPAVPSPSPLTGSVTVHVERVGGVDAPFASEDHARLIRPDGTIAADWRLAADGATPVTVPEGPYTLTAFTVFLSDFIDCVDDPSRPGAETCLQPTLGPAEICSLPVTVSPATPVEARLTVIGGGRCRVELGAPGPDPVDPVPDQPASGPGWTLVRREIPTLNEEGVTVRAPDPAVLALEITVHAAGGNGCGAPTFTGFERSGTTLVARIARTAMGDICAVVSNVAYTVILDRSAIPPGIVAVSHSEACDEPGCLGRGVPVPDPAGEPAPT